MTAFIHFLKIIKIMKNMNNLFLYSLICIKYAYKCTA
ncbi:hypothetical protein [Raoultella terrigena]|nr:hypothetical protein [Raoultella terrigena]